MQNANQKPVYSEQYNVIVDAFLLTMIKKEIDLHAGSVLGVNSSKESAHMHQLQMQIGYAICRAIEKAPF